MDTYGHIWTHDMIETDISTLLLFVSTILQSVTEGHGERVRIDDTLTAKSSAI